MFHCIAPSMVSYVKRLQNKKYLLLYRECNPYCW